MNPTKNDITGKEIKSSPATELYRKNWERIFGDKKEKGSTQKEPWLKKK